MSEKIKVEDYHILSNSFLTIKEIGEAFYHYLELEVNQEPLEFLFLTEKFKKDKSNEDLQLFLEIYDQFIKRGSPKELNISGLSISSIKEYKENYDINKTIKTAPYECLSCAITSILYDLMYDSFPRFIRSEKGEKIILKFINNPLCAVLQNSHQFPYIIDDFMIPFCQEKDELFMKSLLEEGFEWDLVYSLKGKINAYVSKRNYFPNVKEYTFRIHKTDITLDYPLEHLILNLFPENKYKLYDPTTKDVTIPFEISAEEIQKNYPKYQYKKTYPSHITQLYLNFGFPLNTTRIVPYSRTSIHFDKDNFLFISKPFLDEKLLNFKREKDQIYLNNTKVLLMPLMSGYYYSRISPTKTRFVQIHCYDLKGWGSLDIIDKLSVKKRNEALYQNIINFVSKSDPKELTFVKQKENMKNEVFGKSGKTLYYDLNWEDYEK